MTVLYEKERDEVRRIALRAAEIVRGFYERGAKVDWKGEDDPVTEADHAANDLILGELEHAFPNDAVLSEESHDDLVRLDAERVWIVDPLDGTKDFINKTGEFAVMIGLAVAGKPVVGAVCQVMGMRLFLAAEGLGASVEAPGGSVTALEVSRVAVPSDMRLVVTRSHRYAQIDEIVRVLGIKKEKPLGSVGLKVGALAMAEADLYAHLSPGTKEWDTCAPEVILREAGGVITDAFGAPLPYNDRDVHRRRGVLASNGSMHAGIVELLDPIARSAGLEPGPS